MEEVENKNNPPFTIIIPCKNEEKYIGRLLQSLEEQQYVDIAKIPVLIADAGSTDNTLKIIQHHIDKEKLNITVINGGLPSVGRNNGARQATTNYLAFIDADIQLGEPDFLTKVLAAALEKDADLVATHIKCMDGNVVDNFFWACHSMALQVKTYSAGMFIFMKRNTFFELGGFDERIQIGEDYDLTSRVERNKFAIADTFIYTTNRRFQKMGYLNTLLAYIKVPFSKKHRMEGAKHFFDVRF